MMPEGWSLGEDKISITKTFHFKNHYHLMSFINAMAHISHKKNHHPLATFGFKHCEIHYTTHSTGGISPLDYECAELLNQLVD